MPWLCCHLACTSFALNSVLTSLLVYFPAASSQESSCNHLVSSETSQGGMQLFNSAEMLGWSSVIQAQQESSHNNKLEADGITGDSCARWQLWAPGLYPMLAVCRCRMGLPAGMVTGEGPWQRSRTPSSAGLSPWPATARSPFRRRSFCQRSNTPWTACRWATRPVCCCCLHQILNRQPWQPAVGGYNIFKGALY